MKIIKSILVATILLSAFVVRSQVSVNVNIGSPPQWGPVGYAEARYYYLPDVEAYYDVHSSMFIYFGDGVWLHRVNLPVHYSHYDLYGGYKVVLNDYRGDSPHIYFHDHKVKYKKGYRGKAQKTIGNKPGKNNSSTGPKKGSGKQVDKSNSNQSNNKKSSPKGNDNGSGNNKKSGKGGGGKKK
ncbi:MAG: hypothetical protein M3R27_11290 [Bacteroidota bacterium]|nr:hypothetical protein [Bacteroidota bacterium]